MKEALLFLVIAFVISSCDISYYVALNNYGNTGNVLVKHQDMPPGAALSDSDTLRANRINVEIGDTSIVRKNVDAASYIFIAPKNYQVELQPKSLLTPITEVVFKNDEDSTITVKLFGNDWANLKKKGIVETKGFILTKKILINKN